MTRHVFGNSSTHGQLLAICKNFVSFGVRVELFLVQHGDLARVHRDELVLLIPVADKPGTPASVNLFKEETEAAVRLSVHLATVNREPLGDGGLELCDRTSRVLCNIGGRAVAPTHNVRWER